MIKMPKVRRRNHTLFRPCVLVLASVCLLGVSCYAQNEEPVPVVPRIQKFTDDELRVLVAPIALYPDALLAQVLPASAYPVEIVAAYRHSLTAKDPANPPGDVDWDSSVIALLHYPTVLKKMHDDLPWSERLGVAVTYQMSDVSATIQQVRAEANAAGNLVSNDKQVVIREKNVITVVPANPEVIYVPYYDPDVIFIHHDSWRPFISFSVGFGIGLWLTNDFDWYHHRIGIRHHWYYGGWRPYRGPTYWSPPYRPIPQWYTRDGRRTGPTSNYRPRSGTHPSGDRNRIQPRSPAPVRPIVPPTGRPVTPRTLNHSEGINTPGQQLRRESNRGMNSLHTTPSTKSSPERSNLSTGTSRSVPRSHSNQDMMRPSSGQQAHRESSRGASSRSCTERRR